MAETTPKVSLTAKAVESALKRAVAGEAFEIKDAACRGLSLRGRAGRVSWTIRWNLSDFYRRWTIGDHTVLPDEARRRAWHVKSCCQQSVDPTPQITEWITGVPIGKQVREVKSIAWDTRPQAVPRPHSANQAAGDPRRLSEHSRKHARARGIRR